MRLGNIINIGKTGLDKNEFNKLRLVNFLGVITVSVSSTYLVFYIVVKAKEAICINSAVIICYGLIFLFNHLRWYRFAKNWLYSVYIIHLFILTTLVFTKETGFHFYYFAVPLTLFLVFDYREISDKIILTIISVIFFYVCELCTIQEPYIELSRTTNRLLFLSSIFTVFIGIIFVVFLFTHDIKQVEEAREETIGRLKRALNEIHQLRGILPICANCKKIRDDTGYWNQIESYIENHSEAEFSHSICPDCAKKLYPDIDIYENSGIALQND